MPRVQRVLYFRDDVRVCERTRVRGLQLAVTSDGARTVVAAHDHTIRVLDNAAAKNPGDGDTNERISVGKD